MNSRPRMGYPSDLTDAQWARLAPLLPTARAVGRHRSVNLRDIANAINYRWETGCVWRMLPHDYPPWGTVYAYFRHWQRAGVIRLLREILLEPRGKSQPRQVTPAAKITPAWPADDSPLNRNLTGRNLDDSRALESSSGGSSPSAGETERRLPPGLHTGGLLD